MDWHPIQGGVEILLVASCHGNRDKLRPDGPSGSYAETFRRELRHGRRRRRQRKRLKVSFSIRAVFN